MSAHALALCRLVEIERVVKKKTQATEEFKLFKLCHASHQNILIMMKFPANYDIFNEKKRPVYNFYGV